MMVAADYVTNISRSSSRSTATTAAARHGASSGVDDHRHRPSLLLRNEKDVDMMLAKDMNQLSLKEREDIYEAIHGVDHHQIVDESPELIDLSLEELQLTLNNIMNQQEDDQDHDINRKAYDMALQQDESYVTSAKFQLMFLRCDNFNVKKAAKRILLYHERMLQYFGPQVLGRPLYYTDLCKDAQSYLNTGVDQFIHDARDSSGRAIFFINYLQAEKINKSSIAFIQTYIYLFYTAIYEHEMTQKRGIITVSYCIGTMTGKFDGKAGEAVMSMKDWFPKKTQAYQILFDNPRWHYWAPLAWIVMGQELRQRVRIHDGTHLECMYALQSFGIPVHALPVTFDGQVETQTHHKWIEKRKGIEEKEQQQRKKQKEMSSSSSSLSSLTKVQSGDQANQQQQKEQNSLVDDDNGGSIIEKPALADVALWRGRIYQQHPGNVRMRQLIDEYREEYDNAPKGTKLDVAKKVVSTIQEQDNGRFVTQDPTSGYWIVVDNKEAQRRVSKAFRSARPMSARITSTHTSYNNNNNKASSESMLATLSNNYNSNRVITSLTSSITSTSDIDPIPIVANVGNGSGGGDNGSVGSGSSNSGYFFLEQTGCNGDSNKRLRVESPASNANVADIMLSNGFNQNCCIIQSPFQQQHQQQQQNYLHNNNNHNIMMPVQSSSSSSPHNNQHHHIDRRNLFR